MTQQVGGEKQKRETLSESERGRGGRKEVVRMLYFTGTESAAQFTSETSVCYEPPNDLCRHFRVILRSSTVRQWLVPVSSVKKVRMEVVSSLIFSNYSTFTHLAVMFTSHNLIYSSSILIMML